MTNPGGSVPLPAPLRLTPDTHKRQHVYDCMCIIRATSFIMSHAILLKRVKPLSAIRLARGFPDRCIFQTLHFYSTTERMEWEPIWLQFEFISALIVCYKILKYCQGLLIFIIIFCLCRFFCVKKSIHMLATQFVFLSYIVHISKQLQLQTAQTINHILR